MGGSQDSYDALNIGLAVASAGINYLGASNPALGGKQSSPAESAKAWQGSEDYPGVDDWVDGKLPPKGTTVWGGTPGQSNFYTTDGVMEAIGNDAIALNEGLQIAPHETLGYRPGMTAYMVTASEGAAAYSYALANPQYGAGGFQQIFISDPNVLEAMYSRIMK
jgi:hypothetical protein